MKTLAAAEKTFDHWRDLLSLLLSILLHGLPVLVGLIPILALRLLPKAPIEMEILPPRPRPAAAAATKVAAPAPPAKPAPASPGPGPLAQRSATKTPPSVQRLDLSKNRLQGLGTAAIDNELGVRVILRMPTLRVSVHRPTVEALLHAFPDTHILAAGTALAFIPPQSEKGPATAAAAPTSPTGPMARALLDDLDVLFIATADPRDITATVFYAVPRLGSELPQKLKRRKSPHWDTRTLHLRQPDLLAFVRDDLLESAEADAAMVATLQKPGPAVYAEVQNVHQRIRLRQGLPTPVAVRLALSTDVEPEIHARIELASEKDAAQLLSALPTLQKELSSRLFWLGLGSLLDGLKFQGRGSAVEISGRLPRGDTAVLLGWIRQFLPPPNRFLDPPPPLPPTAPPTSAPATRAAPLDAASPLVDLGSAADAALQEPSAHGMLPR